MFSGVFDVDYTSFVEKKSEHRHRHKKRRPKTDKDKDGAAKCKYIIMWTPDCH